MLFLDPRLAKFAVSIDNLSIILISLDGGDVWCMGVLVRFLGMVVFDAKTAG